jgi:hypothetical protein
MKFKRLAAAVTLAVPVGAGLVGAAQPANAALPVSCSADLCMKVTYESGNVATVYMWADNAQFAGHFELQMPNHRTANSPNAVWDAGGTGYEFADWNGGVGQWCGTAWDIYIVPITGTVDYLNVGYTCVTA